MPGKVRVPVPYRQLLLFHLKMYTEATVFEGTEVLKGGSRDVSVGQSVEISTAIGWIVMMFTG